MLQIVNVKFEFYLVFASLYCTFVFETKIEKKIFVSIILQCNHKFPLIIILTIPHVSPRSIIHTEIIN